jgi:arginine decarboxylase
VAPGDIVVVDRNCHKSILHSIIMTGAIPVFLMPTRNNYGIIGPIPLEEFSWKNIQKKIAANPFAREAKNKKPRVLTITQSTYDGILYNVEAIKEMLDGKIDTLHFDEAWLPHAAFHDFYGDYHAIGADRPRCKESMVFSTQSTHKLLAGLSPGLADPGAGLADPQARPRRLQRGLPDAHLDLAAVRDHRLLRRGGGDDGGAGRHRAGRGVAVRGAGVPPRDAQGGRGVGRPTGGSRSGGRTTSPRRASGARRLDAEARRALARLRQPGRGLQHARPDQGHDHHPGPRRGRRLRRHTGIPAAIVTKYLAEHGVIVEKTGLYSFFIMFTIGITKGRWNTMVTELQQFKDDYDRNQPLWRVLPEFVAKHPRYERVGLQGPVRPDPRGLQGQRRRPPDHRDVPVGHGAGDEARPTPSPRWRTARSSAWPIDELEGRVTACCSRPIRRASRC